MNEGTKIKELVQTLNHYRHAYYNLNVPEISDVEYDRMYDQLTKLEAETGIIYSNSPTQTVGYPPVSELKKVPHPHPLLSGQDKAGNGSVPFLRQSRSFAHAEAGRADRKTHL